MKMCPLWPFHTVIFYLLTLFPLWVLCQTAPKILLADLDPPEKIINMDYTEKFNLTIRNLKDFNSGDVLEIHTDSDHIASSDFSYKLTSDDVLNENFNRPFYVTGNFLGKTYMKAKICGDETCTYSTNQTNVIVIRKERIIDRAFTGSVAAFVTLIYINFGCALNWETVKATVKRPIGPAIGFVSQFLFMPLISYVFGLILFPEDYEMQLGMFFTGVSPGGGASNIWTFILGGNLDLSITMTTISTFGAFAMMPFWLFTLGSQIFKSNQMGVPYGRIAGFAAGLIIPLTIGLFAQKYLPKFANLMVRLLKIFSGLLLLFIVIFAIVTNLYLFELFSWRIIIAGMCVPWIGYVFGYVLGLIFRQPAADRLAIAVETGIQNTGISIYLLRFSLSQPEADLTTVIPVSIAIMTPIPMICMYLYQVIKKCVNRPPAKDTCDESSRMDNQIDLGIENEG